MLTVSLPLKLICEFFLTELGDALSVSSGVRFGGYWQFFLAWLPVVPVALTAVVVEVLLDLERAPTALGATTTAVTTRELAAIVSISLRRDIGFSPQEKRAEADVRDQHARQ